MKILMVSASTPDPNSGTGGAILGMAAGLRDLGHEVDCFFTSELKPPLRVVHRNLSALIDAPIATAGRTTSILKHRGPYDLIEVRDPVGYLIPVVKRLGKRSLNRPIVVFNRSDGVIGRMWEEQLQHGDIFPNSWKARIWVPQILIRQENIGFRLSDATIVVSSADLDYASRTTSQQIVQGPPPGITEENLHESSTLRSLDLLFVGSWIDRKGVKYLAEAFVRITRELPGTSFSLVGVGEGNRQLVEQSFPPQCRQHLRITEKTDHRNVLTEYKRHKVFLFPTLSEGFGMALLEAMAAGMSVVTSSVSGAPELVDDRLNGMLVSPRSSEQLAAKALELLTNEKLRVGLGAAATKVAREFTWVKAAAKMSSIYEAVGKEFSS